jgi:2-polyprenyl-3-methyl-5-hydroxy-6-metoxy-1,4-benzoquinol methylase
MNSVSDGCLSPQTENYVSPQLLMDDVRAVCFGEDSLRPWALNTVCKACGAARLRRAFSKYKFQHARCIECGHVSLEEIPPDEILNRLYQGAYYTQVRELYELPRLLNGGEMTPFSAPAEILSELIGEMSEGIHSGQWLDAGGGLGAFADLVRKTLPDWNVSLNDLNSRSLAIAREVLGLTTDNSSPEELESKPMRYDVISAIAVIEHIADPLKFVSTYTRLLRPGGRLLLVTPNFTDLCAEVAKGSSPAVAPPFHIHLFNAQSLNVLLERAGGLSEIETKDMGGPAFSLMQHVDFADYFDISIPTHEDPTPRTVMLKPYPQRVSEQVNALAALEPLMADHFATTDGRMFLVASARRT